MKHTVGILASAAAAGALTAVALIAAGDTAAGEYTADGIFWALVIAVIIWLLVRWRRHRTNLPAPAQPSGARRRPS